MPVRRHTDPIHLKRIWNAIRAASHARVSADLQRITKHLQNVGDYTVEQVELHVKQALEDKLIAPIKKVETGHNQTYRVVQQELPVFDGKDWYCFECHLAGDVSFCAQCYRVFHQDCLQGARKKFEFQKKTNNYGPSKPTASPLATPQSPSHEDNGDAVTIIDDDDVTAKKDDKQVEEEGSSKEPEDKSKLSFDDALCSICNIHRIDNSCDMDKSEINYLLKFVLHRIRAWLPNTITHTMATESRPDWLNDAELTWRANQLFFEQQDMSVIEVKLKTETYVMFSEFLADVYNVQHNVAIFHGIESQEYGASELMLRDTLHDMAELKNCVDCYRHSNEKINSKWFCLPCRVPHELVWAKQKGYPYWPAKVIKETDSHYDVRFFGGKYERSLLLKNFVKPIGVSKESLQIKPTAWFNRSYEELEYHQKLLKDPMEAEKLKAEIRNKKKSPARPKSHNLNTPTIKKTPKSKSRKSESTPKSSSTENQSSPTDNATTSLKRKSVAPIKSVDGEPDQKKKLIENEPNSTISGNNVIDISDGDDDEECQEYSFRENLAAENFKQYSILSRGFETGVIDPDRFKDENLRKKFLLRNVQAIENVPVRWFNENFKSARTGLDETYEQVTSSTETFGKLLSPRSESGMQPLDQPYSDSVEKMRRKLECLPNKKEIIKCAMDCMQIEIDRITNDHNEHLKRLFESHNQQISETKKKQWCYNCEQDAIYHCCWNTAYCSQTCQQQHWQAEHKKVCRRKR